MNVKEKDEVISRMRSAVASKQFGLEEKLCPLIADVKQLCTFDIWFNIYLGKLLMVRHFFFQACIQVCPKNPSNFNVDNVRVAKLLGGGLHDSTVVQGIILKNDAVGTIKRIEKAKVIVMLHVLLSIVGQFCLFLLIKQEACFVLIQNIHFYV